MGGQVRKRNPAIRQALDAIPGIIVCEAADAITFKTAIDQLIQADIDLLVIGRGDGTTHAILGHLFKLLAPEEWPMLMIIPGGTTNMTPLDLGVHDKLRKHLTPLGVIICQSHHCPSWCKRSVLRIEQTGMTAIYGMFFAVGLVAARGEIFAQPGQKTGNHWQHFLLF